MEPFYKEMRAKFDHHIGKNTGEITTSTGRPTDECYVKTVEVFFRECTGRLVRKANIVRRFSGEPKINL